MREQLQTRLNELRQEFDAGQSHLHELEMKEAHLRETLLRISGAIQVLEEALATTGATENEPEDSDLKSAV